MTNKEFIVEVQKSCHLDMQLCLLLTDNLQKMLGKAAVEQIPVLVSGLGVFISHKHPEYIQEDDKTGIMTLYPPRISYHMRTDLVDGSVSASLLLSEYSKITEDNTKSFLDSLVSTINQHLSKGEEVEVPGIGTFKKVLTHQSDLQHLSFVPDLKLKDLVNTPFTCFEPFVINDGKEKVSQEDIKIDVDVEPTEQSIDEDEQDIEDIEEEMQQTEIEVEEESEINTEENNTEETSSKEVVVAVKNETPKKDSVEIQVNTKKQESSDNKLFYLSLALILCCSAFLLWLIFSDNNSDHNIKEAVIVQEEIISPTDTNVAEIIEEKDDTLALLGDSKSELNNSVSPQENSIVVEEPSVQEINASTTNTEVPQKPVETSPEKKSEPVAKEFHRMMGDDGKPVVVTLEQGDRLTLVALAHFGDKAFWPYIFDVNSDKLKAPNLVQAGMKLYLPDPVFYNIDANDPVSLRKAKNRGAQLQK